ncbi:Hypothetical predicted protein [Pelobates cultripes]|uniref:Uncharacterized protein n=1 Tax=Pelobates cultripes TaxID=61616 RepID=A0AAD1RHA4_PELCU|nr:Hypothetical predicted protein [Pelobates cultripes]
MAYSIFKPNQPCISQLARHRRSPDYEDNHTLTKHQDLVFQQDGSSITVRSFVTYRNDSAAIYLNGDLGPRWCRGRSLIPLFSQRRNYSTPHTATTVTGGLNTPRSTEDLNTPATKGDILDLMKKIRALFNSDIDMVRPRSSSATLILLPPLLPMTSRGQSAPHDKRPKHCPHYAPKMASAPPPDEHNLHVPQRLCSICIELTLHRLDAVFQNFWLRLKERTQAAVAEQQRVADSSKPPTRKLPPPGDTAKQAPNHRGNRTPTLRVPRRPYTTHPPMLRRTTHRNRRITARPTAIPMSRAISHPKQTTTLTQGTPASTWTCDNKHSPTRNTEAPWDSPEGTLHLPIMGVG